MGLPSPFEVGRAIGNQGARGFAQAKDENLIEKIIAQTQNDPEAMQNAIGKILSNVSPERQPMAINYLQNAYASARERQKETRQRKAAEAAGISPDLPQPLQVEQFKNALANKRMEQYGLTPQAQVQQPVGQMNVPSGTVATNMPQGQQPPTQPEDPYARFTDGQLRQMSGDPDKRISEPAKQALLQRTEEKKSGLSETLKMRQEIAKKAEDAEQAIAEKERMIEMVDSKKLDDPSVAAFFSMLPMKLGMRFLSPETVEYKSTLINGYRDLRNIFQGQTRVKEIELLEDKLADIYLTDEQKKSILKSSINTLRYDVIRAEAAAEVEKNFPNLKALEFNKKVREIMSPKLEALANRVIDEQKAIIQDAENRKKIPLNPKDSEDAEIMKQILIEAKGNRAQAKKIAKEKGYSW